MTSSKKGAGIWYTSGASQAIENAGVSWVYDWTSTPRGQSLSIPSGVEFVPQVSESLPLLFCPFTRGLGCSAANEFCRSLPNLAPSRFSQTLGPHAEQIMARTNSVALSQWLGLQWEMFEGPFLCARAPLPLLVMLKRKWQSNAEVRQTVCMERCETLHRRHS